MRIRKNFNRRKQALGAHPVGWMEAKRLGLGVQIYAVEPEALGEPQPTSVCFVDVKKILNPQAISAVGWHVSCL